MKKMTTFETERIGGRRKRKKIRNLRRSSMSIIEERMQDQYREKIQEDQL